MHTKHGQLLQLPSNLILGCNLMTLATVSLTEAMVD